jgi:hypothetical protein
MTVSDPGDGFADVGSPLSPAKASMLEFELERRGIVFRLRFLERDRDGDRQAVQVAPADLEAALAVRREILPEVAVAPVTSRPHRMRNAAIAGVLGLVGSLRVVRLVRLPRGPLTAMIVLGAAAVLFAVVFGVGRD